MQVGAGDTPQISAASQTGARDKETEVSRNPRADRFLLGFVLCDDIQDTLGKVEKKSFAVHFHHGRPVIEFRKTKHTALADGRQRSQDQKSGANAMSEQFQGVFCSISVLDLEN